MKYNRCLKIIGVSIAFIIGAIISTSVVYAKSKTLTVTAYDVKGSVPDFVSGGYPNITGGCIVDKIILAYSAPAVANTTKTIEIYTTATSTTAATLKWSYSLSTTTGTRTIDFYPLRELKLTNPAIKKTVNDGVLKATIIYR